MRIEAGKRTLLILSLVTILTIALDTITVSAPSNHTIVTVYGSTPTVDGSIEDGEWDDASTITVLVTDDANCTIYAKQDGVNLYVGLNVPDATHDSGDSCVVIFDVNHDGSTSLQADDMWLRVSRTGAEEELNVTVGGWYPTTVSSWTAMANSTAGTWQTEYNITYSKLDVTAGVDKTLGVMFLIVDKHVMGHYVWPSDASITSPVTWGDMTADISPPAISIVSPENKTYSLTDLPLTFTLSEATSWIGYSLNGEMNVTIGGNTSLSGLSDRAHSLTIYANDTTGNTGASSTVHFTVDTSPPHVEILSPENKTYAIDSVSLSFTTNEGASWIGYSLDGQMNVTITGNTTLPNLLNGLHSLTVFARDTAGNIGSSDMVYFTIDTTPPSVLIVSPENKTYTTTDVALTFTTDEPVLWIAYSLDNNSNVEISGNTTLSTLSDGSHSLIVYAKDKAGNTGISETIHFSVTIEQGPFLTWVVGAIVIIVVVGATLWIYSTRFKKR